MQDLFFVLPELIASCYDTANTLLPSVNPGLWHDLFIQKIINYNKT